MEKFFEITKRFFNSVAGRGFVSAMLLMSSFFAPFSSFPPLFVYIKDNRTNALLALLIGTVICFAMGGKGVGIIYIVLVVFSTIVIGELLKTGLSFGKVVFYSSLILLGVYGLVVIITSLFLSINPMDLIISKIGSFIAMIETSNPEIINQMLKDSGMTKEEMILNIATRFPSAAVIAIVFYVFTNMIMISRFDNKLSSFFKISSLRRFKVSDYFLWPTLAFGALYVFSSTDYNKSTALSMLAMLLFKSILVVYFFQGLAISYLFIAKSIKTMFFRSIIFSIMIVFAYAFITIMGFFDSWFNFRKYLNPKGDRL